MYLIYHEFGKSRLADFRAQAQRDALASAARRARRKQSSRSASRRPWPNQLQRWRATLDT